MMSTNSLHHNAITSCLERLQRDFAVSEKSDTLKYDRSDELQDTYHCTLLFLTYVDVSAYCKPKLKHLNYQGMDYNDKSIQLDIQCNFHHPNTEALKNTI